MDIAIVANSRSGGRTTRPTGRDIDKRLASAGIRVQWHWTACHGHAEKIVRQLDIRQLDAVVAMGGDGTNFQVLNGLLRYHDHRALPPLGIIPLGRGNSFARDLPVITMADGLSAIIRQTTRPVDVCRFTCKGETHYFVNLMGLGFVSDVARTAIRFRRVGDLSYVIGVLHRMLRMRFHHMSLEIDGETISGRNCFVEICNSRFTGGGMLMAPDARIDDGLMDVVVAAPLSRASLLRTFPAIFNGTHGQNPAVRFIRGRSVRIATDPIKTLLPDGELFGTTPADIRVLPHHVRYFC